MQNNQIRPEFQKNLGELQQQIWQINQKSARDFFNGNREKKIKAKLTELLNNNGNALRNKAGFNTEEQKVADGLIAFELDPSKLVGVQNTDVFPILLGYKNAQDQQNQQQLPQQQNAIRGAYDINGNPVKINGVAVPLKDTDQVRYIAGIPAIFNKKNQRIIYTENGERINYSKDANKLNNYKRGDPTFASLVLDEEQKQLQNSGGSHNVQYPQNTLATLQNLLLEYKTKNIEEKKNFKYDVQSKGINPYSRLEGWFTYLQSLQGIDQNGKKLEQGDRSRDIQPVLNYIREESKKLPPNAPIDLQAMHKQFPMFSMVELKKIHDFQCEWSRVIESLKSNKKSGVPFIIGIGALLAGLGGVIASAVLMTQTAGYSVDPATPHTNGDITVPDHQAVQPTTPTNPQIDIHSGRGINTPGGQTLDPSVNPAPNSVDPSVTKANGTSAGKPNAELGTILLIIFAIVLAIAILTLIYNSYKKENEMEDMPPAPKPLREVAPQRVNQSNIKEENPHNIDGGVFNNEKNNKKNIHSDVRENVNNRSVLSAPVRNNRV